MSTDLISLSPLWQGLTSVAQELVVLLVFFATWSLTRGYSRAPVDPEKQAVRRGKDPLETAKVIRSLCADQFTRALRLYRDLVKQDLDKAIADEGFYLSLVEAAVRVGKADIAIQILTRMQANGFALSSPFFQSVVKMLAARKLYRESVDVYRRFGAGCVPEPLVFSCLVLAASELGEFALARELVDERRLSGREAMPLFRAYVRAGDWQAAVSLARALLQRTPPLDILVLNTALAAGAKSTAAVPAMQALLEEAAALEESSGVKMTDIVSYNTLMKAHAQLHDVEACFALLETIVRRSAPDCVTFSTLLDACIQEGEHDRAAVALERMEKCGVKMTCVLMTTLMKGFVRSNHLDKAYQLYLTMKSGTVRPDMITYSLLIKAFCDASQMDSALQVLEDMLQSGCPVDDIVFTHLIDGCCLVSNVALAEQLFRDMLRAKIKPSVYAITGLVKVYGKCSMSEKAVAVVATMEQKFGVTPTVVVYTCVVSGLLRQRKHAEAYSAFQEMMKCCQVDTQSVQTMLYGLVDAMMWTQFNDVAAQFLSQGKPDISAECFCYALDQMVQRGGVQAARVLRGIMEKHGVEVRMKDAPKRLQL